MLWECAIFFDFAGGKYGIGHVLRDWFAGRGSDRVTVIEGVDDVSSQSVSRPPERLTAGRMIDSDQG